MSKIKFEIKNRWTGSVLFEYEKENNTLKDTVEQAVKEGVYLRGADLTGAYLKGAYLKGAYLKGVYLRGAYLEGAYLEGADLTGAYLRGADLTGAYLKGAYLKGAYLKGVYLRGAYLEGAYLGGADLKGAYLGGADLKGADLKGADLKGANLKGAYIYLDNNEINSAEIVKNFEEKNNIKITETHINKNIIPTRWNCFWKYGLTICNSEAIEKEAEENKYTERCIDIEIRNEISELVRAVKKLIKESEKK